MERTVLEERDALSMERLASITKEHTAQEPFGDYFRKTASFVIKMDEVYRKIKDGKTESYTLEHWQAFNQSLYEEILPENYEHSYGNPKYASKVSVWRSGSLIYRDNTRYEPEKMDMEGIGMYEGYTHMANIFLTGGSEELQQNIWEILEQEPECDGGVTKLVQNDLAVRIFGQRAQKLQEVAEKMKAAFL